MPRRRKTDDVKEALEQASVSKSENVPNFGDWVSRLENKPSFAEWYLYKAAYNGVRGLGDPTFNQWYSDFTTIKDKTVPVHPYWFGLGAHESHNSLCDSSLESHQEEYEKLFKEYLKNSEEK